MTERAGGGAPGRLALLPPVARWLLLAGGSAAFAAALFALHVPAALLLGPLLAAIAFRVHGGVVRVPRVTYYAAQAIIGCLIARAVTPATVIAFARDWPLIVGSVSAIIAAGVVVGRLAASRTVLPLATAMWGLSPGAAPAMIVLAEGSGADTQMVALMQYLRALIVALTAAAIATLAAAVPGAAAPPAAGTLAVPWVPFAQTIGIAAVACFVGVRWRVPSGAMFVPMMAGGLLQASGSVELTLPPWLLAASYAVLGWHVGIGFSRELLAHAGRALPRILASIAAIIAICGALALALHGALGVSLLTAFLATAPGGIDAVAVIAAASDVDQSFVMALQALRCVAVILVAAAIERFVRAPVARG